MRTSAQISRREFVRTSAGLVVAFYLPGRAARRPESAGAAFATNAWLRVGTDGVVTLTVDKSEMGQGSQTARAMSVADELDGDWSEVGLGHVPESPEAG